MDAIPDFPMLTQDLVMQCPHCQEPVLIAAINCQIFRHAAYKQSGEQIPPHTSQQECERLVEGGAVFGCGKPFRIVKNEQQQLITIICDYI